MTFTTGMRTSVTSDSETPQYLFDELNAEFHFTLDVCASDFTHKCDKYYTVEDDALVQDWHGVCWMNPPYGRQIGPFIQKAYETGIKGGIVVCLIPARTDTKWWHDYVMKASDVRFIRGRLTFANHINPAPFPSAIVVFGNYPQIVQRAESCYVEGF